MTIPPGILQQCEFLLTHCSHSYGTLKPSLFVNVSHFTCCPGLSTLLWDTSKAHWMAKNSKSAALLLCSAHSARQISMTWVKVKVKSLSRVRLFATPWTAAYQAPPSVGFSRQEYCSGVPFPSPRDLPNPGIEPRSPAWQAGALPSEPPGKTLTWVRSPVIPGFMPFDSSCRAFLSHEMKFTPGA